MTFYLTSLSLGFGLYLYPSLFLAVDRLLVILFPLKFRDWSGKVKFLKCTLIGLHVIFIVLGAIISEVYGIRSTPSAFFNAVFSFLTAFLLLSITVMYSTMAVIIIKSSRQMAHAIQRGNAKNR